LFFAGTPLRLRINSPLVIRTPQESYRLGSGNPEGAHYGVYSELEASEPRLAPELSDEERLAHLILPPVDGRVVALARRVTEGLESDEARARAIESYLRTHYGYSTEALAEEPADPLAHFLFERRRAIASTCLGDGGDAAGGERPGQSGHRISERSLQPGERVAGDSRLGRAQLGGGLAARSRLDHLRPHTARSESCRRPAGAPAGVLHGRRPIPSGRSGS